jgi:hypothetical protein
MLSHQRNANKKHDDSQSEWLSSTKQTTTNFGKNVEKKELSHTVDGNEN